MSERQKESRFLKTLILCDHSEQGRRLQEKIKRAEKDERSIRCAVFLVGVVAMLSLSGLGYAAVFVPEFARFTSHIATRICSALGLGSLLCMLVFVGYWLWYRAASNRIFEECRRFLRPLMESRINQLPPSLQVVELDSRGLPVYGTETPKPQDQPVLLSLSKIS